MRRLRNCNLTTVAPTGTISIIAGCSSGIEPLFAVAFMRNQAGVLMPDVNEDFVRLAKQEGWYSGALMQRIAAAGHIHFDEVPAKWQRVFVTAHDVTPEWHIQMQAAFQEFTDSAISKTCNFANDATEEYVEKIYRYAYKLGCKGVTVYRDASREMQVLSTGSTAKKVKEQATGATGEDGQRQLAAAAAGYFGRRGRVTGSEEGAFGARRDRPRDREVDAGQAGRAAGLARCGGPAPARSSSGAGWPGGAACGGASTGFHRRLSRLRVAARLRGGLREVSRVRVLGVRLSRRHLIAGLPRAASPRRFSRPGT